MKTKLLKYEGKQLTVTYDVARCIHAAECVKGLPEVFNPEATPWINPDAADSATLLAVLDRCPTGALRAILRDGATQELPTANTVSVDPDGPLYVRGRAELLDANGEIVLRDTRIALCRCGASKNKPLCDGSHVEAGFKDAGALGKFSGRPAGGDGMLSVGQARNGPLLTDGPLEIEGADGERVSCGKSALCRCGESANKPFCDGAHKSVGFQG